MKWCLLFDNVWDAWLSTPMMNESASNDSLLGLFGSGVEAAENATTFPVLGNRKELMYSFQYCFSLICMYNTKSFFSYIPRLTLSLSI